MRFTAFFPAWSVACALLCGANSAAVAQQRPAITGLAFVRVYSSDPAASQRFYGGVLGYNHLGANGLGRYDVNAAQWIDVVAMPSPAPVAKIAAIGFTTRDVAALARYVQSRGVTLVEPLRNARFGLHDPEGRLVEFVQQQPASAARRLAAHSPRAASHRIIHTGFTVKDRAAESHFYHDLLGFTAYWEGGRNPGTIDYVCLQVPDGTDWVEYMMNPADRMTAHQLGSANHMALGMEHMADAIALLQQNGCSGGDCGDGESKNSGYESSGIKSSGIRSSIGRSGRVQLSIFDPDETRAEYMEFAPTREPCCSPMTGRNPSEVEDR